MASENPLQMYLEKKAGFGQELGNAASATFSSRNIAKGIVGAGAGALASGAVAGIGAGAHMLYDAITKSRDFKNMLAENEDVAQLHAENPREVNRMFSSLRTFAPEFTSDPTVAGAYMRQMVGNPNGVNGIVNQALDSRRKMLGSSGGGVGSAMLQGAQKGMASPDDNKSHKDPVGFMRANKPVRRSGGGGFGEVREELERSNERSQARQAQEAQEGPGEASGRPFKNRSQAWEAASAQRSGPKTYFAR